jgi:integrase
MPKITKPLTDTEIKNAAPRGKEYSLADGSGLSLRVSISGRKYWLFNYQRPITKVRTNISFGIYPEISLQDAREKRAEYRKLLNENIDPKDYRQQQSDMAIQAANATLKNIAKDWLAVKRTKVTVDHADDIWRSLELHIFPFIGNKPINSITAPIAIKTIKPIEAKGSLETVKRLCQRLNEIMTFAVNTGILEGANPIIGIKDAFGTPQKRNYPTLKPEQLDDLVRRIHGASIHYTTKYLLLWQLHTMVRPSEAAGTAWSEIDLEKRLWTIPASRMKKKREHTVPLTDQMIEILTAMEPISCRCDYVFPSDRKPLESTNAQTANMALKRMGYEGQLVSHGLRALASTSLNEKGFEPDIIETALAHVDSNSVRAAYNRADYIDRRRSMMDWWSKRISQSNLEMPTLQKHK